MSIVKHAAVIEVTEKSMFPWILSILCDKDISISFRWRPLVKMSNKCIVAPNIDGHYAKHIHKALNSIKGFMSIKIAWLNLCNKFDAEKL